MPSAEQITENVNRYLDLVDVADADGIAELYAVDAAIDDHMGHVDALRAEFAPQRFQAGVLGREAAPGRHIDDQQRLALVLRKRPLAAVDVLGGKVVGSGHARAPGKALSDTRRAMRASGRTPRMRPLATRAGMRDQRAGCTFTGAAKGAMPSASWISAG